MTEKAKNASAPEGGSIDYRKLAERIYDLDQRIYEVLGSSLGRVFSDDRQRTIDTILISMDSSPDQHYLRSQLALIGNMARTIPEGRLRDEIMEEYESVTQDVVHVASGFKDVNIGDRERMRLNTLSLSARFSGDSHLVICISRSYGSGGTAIGFELADRLGIDYYDAEIFRQVVEHMEAEKDGIRDFSVFAPPAKLSRAKRRAPDLSSYEDHVSLREKLRRLNRYHGLPARDAVFFNQSDMICRMARENDFVIMGRCADVILKNNNIPHISLFITAPIERRAQRIMRVNNVDLRHARAQIAQMDHQHASYYEYFTGLKWGDALNYDQCINSSSYGIDGSVELILNLLTANQVRLPHPIKPARTVQE